MLNKLKNEPTIFLFRKMWKFSEGNRRKVVLFMFLFLGANLTKLLEPLILATIINKIQKNGIDSENINFLLLIALSYLALSLLMWIMHGPARVHQKLTAFFTEKLYRKYLIEGVLNLKLQWHSNRDSGNTIDKINKATHNLYLYTINIDGVIRVVVSLIGTCLVLFFFNVYIAIFGFLFAMTTFYILYNFDKKLIVQQKEMNETMNEHSAKTFDALSNITSVIILNIKKGVLKNVIDSFQKLFSTYKKNIHLTEWKWFTGHIIFDAIIAFSLAFYLFYNYKNSIIIEIGTLSALYLYLSRLMETFFGFSYYYEGILKQKATVQNAESIEKSFTEKEKTSKKLIKNWKEVKIKNLNFSYQETEGEVHLDDVNLDLKSGERIALIGESGSGKTTFLKVLHGLYDNAQAKISIDNKQESKTNFADLDLKTMLVPQEPELFSSSVRENITFGLDYNKEEIKKMTDLAEFTSVIKKLPKKFDSVINEKGVNLSGGQKQRLALARALLFAQDKNIILLDESTSSVDPNTEVKIYKNIFNHFKNKTVLASIHKINLLKYFDRIIIFENGKITNNGTFDELLKRNKKFKNEWEEYIKKA